MVKLFWEPLSSATHVATIIISSILKSPLLPSLETRKNDPLAFSKLSWVIICGGINLSSSLNPLICRGTHISICLLAPPLQNHVLQTWFCTTIFTLWINSSSLGFQQMVSPYRSWTLVCRDTRVRVESLLAHLDLSYSSSWIWGFGSSTFALYYLVEMCCCTWP